ncbi:amidase [Uliginosibacterium sp. H3]|uniref:Amidase n=1 Tax=Uliginosibacterium silvisoli TaxID=3114758 RepID=A0ABU6K7G0_9RHOO|nr:amidase [Uliginosibacterium sp. H3]
MSSSTANPGDLPATELLGLYRKKALSPVEVTQAILTRIEATQPAYNAYRLVDADAALAQARASEQRWLRGEALSDVDGIPAAFKDLLHVRGWPTRKGSLATLDTPQAEDSPVAARLREGGAVLLGKTNTAEFGWKSITESALAGVTRNAWSTAHTPTGSSGGAATAAALGLGPLQIATDGGGSIRVPASVSGVFGFKPSFGRVPGYPPAHNGSLFHLGPLTRTVSDAALLLNTISGFDARDWTSLPQTGRDWRIGLNDGVRGLRIAYSRTLGYVKVAPHIAEVIDKAVTVFSELGAIVEEVDPGFTDPRPILDVLAAERAIRLKREIPPERFHLVDEEIREHVERASPYTLTDYVAASEQRQSLAILLRHFHERYDLLLTPVLADSVPKLGERANAPFSVPFNLTQQPAASVPAGFDVNGLPVGLHIVGPAHRDDLVLRAARAFEATQVQRWPSVG